MPDTRAKQVGASRTNQEGLLGILAGFLITFAGLLVFASGTNDSCSDELLERSSYIGGIEVESQPQSSAVRDSDVTDNAYGLEICDTWPSPLARWITLLGAILIPMIGGAAATRIGPGNKPWRAIAATGPAALLLGWILSPAGVEIRLGETLFLGAAAAFLGALGSLFANLRPGQAARN